jgi:hypothetical protein
MAKIINWHKLTPFQRNALIAEKVMGRRIIKDEWVYWLVERADGTGTEEIPRYSQSMDDAWLLWPKLTDYDVQRKFLCAWIEDDDPERYDWKSYNPYLNFLDVESMQHIAPERIGIAALRALGYEVLTEEISQ